MSIPKDPRQMMINMMYLVLTAMLALNISAEILNAFIIVNDGIQTTNNALDSKNAGIYTEFDKKVQDDPTAAPWRQKAYDVKALADSMDAYIDVMIADITAAVGGLNDEGELSNPKDTHEGTRYMITEGNGQRLKDEILRVRQQFIGYFVAEGDSARGLSIPLNAIDPAPQGAKIQTWQEYNFNEVPAVAAITILNKLKNDVKNAESQVIEFLGSRINAAKFTFDALKGRAISNKPYLNLGDNYEADIFVSASSSGTEPRVHIGRFSSAITKSSTGDYPEIKGGAVPLQAGYITIDESEGGIVKYSVNRPGEGPKSYQGVIEIKNPNTGETSYYPFDAEYTVASTMAVVSAEKMNVFYIGVDNPVSVSAPGYQPNQITASISSGTLTSRGTPGKYNVNVSTPGEVKITLTGKTDDAGSRTIGDATFRVKYIPDPTVYAGNRPSGIIPAGELRALTGIYAKADGFDFDVRFEVQSFEFTYKKARTNQLRIIQNQGTLFNGEIRDILRQVGPGDQVWMDNIRIKSPDNRTRTGNMSLKVI